MTFRRTRSIYIILVIYLLLLIISYFSPVGSSYIVGLSISVVVFNIYLIGSVYQIKDEKIEGRFLFFRKSLFAIKEIKFIEAVSIRRLGHINILIKSPLKEDYYVINLHNGDKIKIDTYYTYNGETLGRFLNKQWKVKLVDIEEIKVQDGGV